MFYDQKSARPQDEGRLLGWEIVDRLRMAAKRIKLDIPIAEEGDEILMYVGRANAEAHCIGVCTFSY